MRFFARQLMIGAWQAMRYRSGAHYDPWVATDAGSIFLLSVDDDHKAAFEARLTELVATGLPEAGDIPEPRWQHCPMARVNGFGEIGVWTPIEPKRFGGWYVDVRVS
ncbi:hypothetical protein A33M_1380 [Rhodovulum sp. PH10]|nr:hypothetical protein A33M_1380 [Rhodovulum sp. PH10]